VANLSASDLAGRRIRQIRQRRGWTVKELAERCADVGAPGITPTVITNLETRRRASRQITIDELLVLAYILGVPPLLLFVPADGSETLHVGAGVEKDSIEAAAWVANDEAMVYRVILPSGSKADTLRTNYVKYPQETSSLTLLRYIAEVVRNIEWLEAQLAKWRASPSWQERSPDEERHTTDWLMRYGERLAQLYVWLDRLGYMPPDLPSGVEAALKRVGVPDWRELAMERPEMFDFDEGEVVPGGEGS
jgi:transcriptional regulator with XRE-family HTH domain